MTLRIVGVRHHSPACARLVDHVLRTARPAHVLVEGPADFNERLDELLLPHRLPVALFSYYQGPDRSHASWAPFCRHSPEWVALTVGRELGASVRFVDLPAWDEAFAEVRNRYRDRPDRAAEYVAALCRRLAVDDSDTLWDHLFEQPMPCAELEARLDAYFLALRAEDPADDRDRPREAFMAAHLRAAVASGGDVVVVCGGYHAPALARLAEEGAAQGGEATATAPPPPVPADGGRHGTYLVPYSFRRLDSFVGYESGLPSPAFYDASWEHGEAAGELLLRRTTERLRRKRQPVSPADLIACLSLARGLARARGHATLTRTDLLDGIAGALVKDALDVPLPWSYRGTLLPRTDPLLVEVVAAFSGEVEGALAAGTPRPPLLADVAAQLLAEGLAPRAEPFTVTLDLHREVPRSRLLHRLRVLGIPGFQRLEGPAWATDAELREVWEVRQVFETESALIEAAAWGASLESAAAARLEEALGEAAGGLARLAALLGEAVFVGIEGLSGRVLAEVAAGVEREPSFGELGEAGLRLLALFRHDDLLGARGSATLGAVLTALAERGLWLLEGLAGETAPADERELRGMVLLRDLARFAEDPLRFDNERAAAVMERRAADRRAPPAIRGATIGWLWSRGRSLDGAEAVALAGRGLRGVSRPASLGDFLAGLFVVAREEVLGSAEVVAAVDAALAPLPSHDFLVALPALRLAFSYFPPLERERIASRVVGLHADAATAAGGTAALARSLLRLEVRAEDVARGLAVEAAVSRRAGRYGLGG